MRTEKQARTDLKILIKDLKEYYNDGGRLMWYEIDSELKGDIPTGHKSVGLKLFKPVI